MDATPPHVAERDGDDANSALPALTPRKRLGLNYWKLWSATAISNAGDGIRFAALPLLATTLTRDPLLVAGTVFASQLPWLLFALVGGALVDRLNRRTVMWTVDLFRAAAIGLLGLAVVAGYDSIVVLYAVVFVLGTAETLFDSAAFALLPSLVPEDDLDRANGPLQATLTLNQEFLGPPVGALLFAAFAALPFFVDAASFAVAALIALAIRGDFAPERHGDSALAGLKHEIIEGVQWVWAQPLIRGLTVSAAIQNIVFFATFSVRVLFASQILGLDTVGFGVLMAADGAGGVLGALVASRVSKRLGRAASLVGAIAALAASTLVFGLTSNPWVAWFSLAVGGAAAFVWIVVSISVRQALTPNHLLGRMNSVSNTVAWGAIPVGAAVGGILARIFGLRAPFLFGSALSVAALFVVLRLTPHLRTLQPEVVTPAEVGPPEATTTN